MSTKNRRSGIYLFVLKNGPIHNIADHIEGQIEALSVHFDCEVWAPGSISLKKIDARTGNRIHIVKTQEPAGLIARLPYLLRVLGRAFTLRFTRRRICVLVQDPLKGGVVGVMAKWLSGGSLVVEINGTYASEQNYVDYLDVGAARKKIEKIRRLSGFVLRFADGVRALYNGQMEGLGPIPARAQFRVFFDFASTFRFKDLGETPTILFVGYPFYLKGVDLLINAFEKICADFPDWRLRIIGHDLKTEAQKFIRGDRIEVIKAMSNQDLVEHVGKCGIFVLPSRSEGAPRVLLEAGAAGKPRLASNVGGIHTLIEDGVDGLIFNKEDVEELAAKLSKLMASPDLRRKLGERAKARVRTEFSSAAYAEKMGELVSASIAN